MPLSVDAFPRLFVVPAADGLIPALAQGRALGFRQAVIAATVDFSPALDADADRLASLLDAGRQSGLEIWLDLPVADLPLKHPLVVAHPAAFAVRRTIAHGPVDPRQDRVAEGRALARFGEPGATAVLEWWIDRLARLVAAGVRGFVARRPDLAPPSVWTALTGAVRGADRPVVFMADSTGLARTALPGLVGCGFDYCLSSLPWWDGRASWLAEEHAELAAIAPVVAPVAPPMELSAERWPAALDARLRRLQLAGALGDGWMMPAGYDRIANPGDGETLAAAIRHINARFEAEPLLAAPGRLRALTGAGAPVTALLRGAVGPRGRALLLLVNPGRRPAAIPPTLLLQADCDLGRIDCLSGDDGGTPEPDALSAADAPLAPGAVRLLALEPARPVVTPVPGNGQAVFDAAAAPRVIIAAMTPQIDQGGHAVKRVIGDRLVVEADIFTDGHEQLAAALLFKAGDDRTWSRVAMTPLPNDRWRAEIPLARTGRHLFAVEAWLDVWGGFTRDLAKKRDAGLDLALEIREGVELIRAVRKQARPRAARQLGTLAARVAAAAPEKAVALLLAPGPQGLIAEVGLRPFSVTGFVQPLEVERPAARFSSWYELFPRSQTDDPARPGRLLDVIDRLPTIRRMGFDVLYFPPIHPIGATNRKGRNNSLTAEPGDPGSPYAIGAPTGGHRAIHAELGTLADFQTLLAAAAAQGIEIALDFAIQCSPDHPWLKQHPGWFQWRPDGSMKYAENPPKKYQDIVNVDFYGPDAMPGLWVALRDIVLYWVAQGVKIFRVDNPHTKPLPFWRWMIADVRGAHPEVIFLAEAFTRPKPMYHLAKIGFSQSYTYFTWRHTKAELTDYLTELNETEVRDYFRPHFFVNTPDINPYFLQTSGRAGFLIRAALAATLSGLWGVYSGFELCESTGLPGREEYLDSEKYQIRPRDWSQPGNIIDAITQLNRIRKAEPALQSHLGLRFHTAFNDQVLYFAKRVPGQVDRILVAISLDPHQPQAADIEVPLWEWGLPDDGTAAVTDLLSGTDFTWRGKIQHVRLTPDAPYAIWRVRPGNEA